MQQFGQPPAEIIKDLAPGLKFDENGMPIMPNMGPGNNFNSVLVTALYTLHVIFLIHINSNRYDAWRGGVS